MPLLFITISASDQTSLRTHSVRLRARHKIIAAETTESEPPAESERNDAKESGLEIRSGLYEHTERPKTIRLRRNWKITRRNEPNEKRVQRRKRNKNSNREQQPANRIKRNECNDDNAQTNKIRKIIGSQYLRVAYEAQQNRDRHTAMGTATALFTFTLFWSYSNDYGYLSRDFPYAKGYTFFAVPTM